MKPSPLLPLSLAIPGFAAFGLAATLVLPAQQATKPDQPAPVTTLKVQTNEVMLPVIVRDKKGQSVPNLKADDFILHEDGRPQVIKSFSRETNLPFRLGLLVDTSRSQEAALPAEKEASGKFIDQMLSQPGDKAFLLHFDHEVELLQDFTATKSRLHHELDEMSTSNSSGEEDSRGGDQNGQNGERRRRRGGTQLYDAIYLAANELMLKQDGRKSLIVLSDGVDRGSKETLNGAVDAAEKANLSVYCVYFKGEQERQNSGFGPGGGHRGGIGFPGSGGGGYPGGGGGYPGGRRGGGPGGGGSNEPKVDGKKILEQIAGRTGGLFFEAKKKDSFDEIYGQIGSELHSQYLLTYSPDKKSEGDSDGFHKVMLKAKDEKLDVTTREGYYTDAKD
ncbi:MAG TPA: VWA domain-containing protein [Acidobacteriaceae bacterium]|nr:VWA domain-containing protein [Acidobacteriaceae bacterium]